MEPHDLGGDNSKDDFVGIGHFELKKRQYLDQQVKVMVKRLKFNPRAHRAHKI